MELVGWLRRRQRTQSLKKICMSSESKIIGGIFLATIVIVVGAVFYFTQAPSKTVTEEEIVSNNGLHWHPKLSITIKGKNQEIPKDIGIGAIHQPLHTHDSSGTIHMEMQGVVTKEETRLGEFFRIWGKQFTSSCIFDKCNGEGGKLRMLVNGEENKEFDSYRMRDNDSIEIIYE